MQHHEFFISVDWGTTNFRLRLVETNSLDILAWSWGASAVKVFPATQLGPQYIKDVLAPLNNIRLIPTGGVRKENIKAYFEAGAFGLGMGSSLFPEGMIRQGDFEGLRNHLTGIKRLLP